MESGPCGEPGMVNTRSRRRAGRGKGGNKEEGLAFLRRMRGGGRNSAGGPSAGGSKRNNHVWWGGHRDKVTSQCQREASRECRVGSLGSRDWGPIWARQAIMKWNLGLE